MPEQQKPVDERTHLAQALVAHRDAVDLEWVQDVWGEYGPASTQAMYDAGEFIALYDALMQHREAAKPGLTAAELYQRYATAPFEERAAARKAWRAAERLEEG